MKWKTIRLELARTPEFPSGSVSRAYLLRLPINDLDEIDEEALRHAPKRATVRRYWASEPDKSGRVQRHNGGWSLEYGGGTAYFDSQPLRENGEIIVVAPDGCRLPFRVASVRAAGS